MLVKKDKDDSFGEYGDMVIGAIADGVEYQGEMIQPKSNLLPYKDQQIPNEVLKKRINTEIRDLQIVAGMTTIQRKILKAKIDTMRTRVYSDDKNYTTDAEIARKCKVSDTTIVAFNHNETCRNALMLCTKLYVETVMPDLMANLMLQAKDSWQPNIKLLEIIQQYAQRQKIETTNRNLNVNLEMGGNSPEGIMRQVVVKLGAANYDRERFQSEIMAVWDNCKSEGAF